MKWNAMALLSLALSACSGGGGGAGDETPGAPLASAAFICDYVGGGDAKLDALCAHCPTGAVEHGGRMIDTDLASAARVSFYNPADTSGVQYDLTMTATAQEGIVFPAGTAPGIAVRLPVGDVAYSVAVATLLNGVTQESRPPASHAGTSSGELRYFGFPEDAPATMEFDAVQVTLTESAPNFEEHVFEIIEFCGDGARNSD
jgi:hypothetical protein